MANNLKELKAQQKQIDERIRAIYDEQDKRGGESTKDEISEVKKLTGEIGELNERIADLQEAQAMREGHESRMKAYTEPVTGVPFPGTTNNFSAAGNHGQPGQGFKSLGQQVLEDKDMAAFLKTFEGRGSFGNRKIESPPVEVKTLITGAGSTTGGPFVNIDYKPIVDMSYARPLNIRDIITIGETNSDTVEFVRITGVTNTAAPVAEATATGDGTGAKPESAIATEAVTETVKTIAHWVPATNRALSDAGQLRTLIDSFLRYGLQEELEDQILTGSGVGQNFTGIMNTTGTSTQSFDTDALTTTRKARTKVQTQGRARPNAWVMHPLDWESFDLLQDNEARYYYGGPAQMGTPRLWGLPVVESEGMTQGFCIVADFKLAVLWDRMQATITMSNSHSDFFVRNLVAILAEMRAAFGVIRPAAFVETDIVA